MTGINKLANFYTCPSFKEIAELYLLICLTAALFIPAKAFFSAQQHRLGTVNFSTWRRLSSSQSFKNCSLRLTLQSVLYYQDTRKLCSLDVLGYTIYANLITKSLFGAIRMYKLRIILAFLSVIGLFQSWSSCSTHCHTVLQKLYKLLWFLPLSVLQKLMPTEKYCLSILLSNAVASMQYRTWSFRSGKKHWCFTI